MNKKYILVCVLIATSINSAHSFPQPTKQIVAQQTPQQIQPVQVASQQPAQQQPGLGHEIEYIPYLDITAPNIDQTVNDLVSKKVPGVNKVMIAFLVDPSTKISEGGMNYFAGGANNPNSQYAWNPSIPANHNRALQILAKLSKAGIKIIISTGGWCGVPYGMTFDPNATSPSAQEIANNYRNLLAAAKGHGITTIEGIDADVEGCGHYDSNQKQYFFDYVIPGNFANLLEALKQLKLSGEIKRISLTLPSRPLGNKTGPNASTVEEGLVPINSDACKPLTCNTGNCPAGPGEGMMCPGVNLDLIKEYRDSIDAIDIMTMNSNCANAGHPKTLECIENQIKATQQSLKSYGLNIPIEICPMLGQNDWLQYQFSTADASGVRNLMNQYGIKTIHSWSLCRDNKAPGTADDVASQANFINSGYERDGAQAKPGSPMQTEKYQFAKTITGK